MSYDITFIQKSDDQSWSDAMIAHEQAVMVLGVGEAPAPDAVRAEWDRIAGLLLACHPGMSVFDAPSVLELTNHDTGLQVFLYEKEAGISIPYWHPDGGSNQVMETAKKLAAIIERETGLTGYDSQRDCGFFEGDVPAEESGELLRTTSQKIQHEDILKASKKEKRPWWVFWKRS